MMLQHPYTTPTLTLTLPSPDLNDSEDIAYNVTFNRAMANTLRTYVKDKSTKLTLTFKLITRAKITEIQTFIDTVFGNQIKMTDWRSRVWSAYIISNPVEYRNYGDDRYSFTLELEATLV